jgi:signal transduction histidine kinase
VQDRGIGIEPQHQQRVFQLFERLNPSIEGSGVGLTIVQRCVELHGGTVQLESMPNQGCCFTIRIPQP